jgi:putative colanic acid biosynthesis glycosyltransferase
VLLVRSVSIITINFNNRAGLARTIDSFNHLPYGDFLIEHVFVDGGSKDGSLCLINEFGLTMSNALIVSEQDRGIFDAMNKGVTLATGEFVLFMNSGDCIVTGAFHSIYDRDLNIFATRYRSASRSWIKKVGSLSTAWGLPFCHQSVIVRRALHLQCPFDLDCLYADLIFFGDLLKNGASVKIHEAVLAEYEVGGASDVNTWRKLKNFFTASFRVNGIKGFPCIGVLVLRVIKFSVFGSRK